MAPRGYDSWDEVYQNEATEGLPWFYPGLDPDFADALEALALPPGRALDLGSGPGTQAIALARRGFSVVGSDLSPAAVEAARTRAKTEAPEAALEFAVDDFLATKLEGPFDLVLDRGVFHLFEPKLRHTYLANLVKLLAPGGFLLLKCFSHRHPPGEGPNRIHPDELQGLFGRSFDARALRETEFQGQHPDGNPLALFAAYQRRA